MKKMLRAVYRPTCSNTFIEFQVNPVCIVVRTNDFF